MPSYTTIRISVRDRERLRRLAKLMGAKSLAEALRLAIAIAEQELEKHRGDVEKVVSSLRYARDLGRTNAEDVDRYLYGEAH